MGIIFWEITMIFIVLRLKVIKIWAPLKMLESGRKSGQQSNVSRLNGAKKKRRRIKHRKCYGPNAGHFNVTKQHNICGALRQFVRKETASRGEMVKAVWTYVKKKHLQCKGRGRIFVIDARLATVLGKEGMEQDGFKIMTSIEKHILCEK